MDSKLILEIIEAVKQTDFMEVELIIQDTKLKISRRQSEAVAAVAAAPAALPGSTSPVLVSGTSVEKSTQSSETPTVTVANNQQSVLSPMVGTFYRSSAPDKPSYVNIGDVVTKGQVLCIIEAMKLFNEIESEVNGRIVKILVENAQPVEYEQPLFIIEPTD